MDYTNLNVVNRWQSKPSLANQDYNLSFYTNKWTKQAFGDIFWHVDMRVDILGTNSSKWKLGDQGLIQFSCILSIMNLRRLCHNKKAGVAYVTKIKWKKQQAKSQ